MSMFNRVMNFIGFGDEEENERDHQVQASTEGPENQDGRRARGAVVSIHSQKTSKVMLSEPQTLEDVKDLVEQLRSRRIVLINLQNLKESSAMRVVDMLDGAICAFNGKMVKVGLGIYLCAPDNFEINGTIDADRYANLNLDLTQHD
jgi:cell division inhibitor SepF